MKSFRQFSTLVMITRVPEFYIRNGGRTEAICARESGLPSCIGKERSVNSERGPLMLHVSGPRFAIHENYRQGVTTTNYHNYYITNCIIIIQ